MSAPRKRQAVSKAEWQEMADLKEKITTFPSACTVAELERFSDLFARTMKENHYFLTDQRNAAG